MNVRALMGNPAEYYAFNREERFYVALMFAALLQKGDNLRHFLDLLSSKLADGSAIRDCSPTNCCLYFEYAYLRDSWNSMGTDYARKRQVILNWLHPSNTAQLKKMSNTEFNNFFGAGKRGARKDRIMSPATWSIAKFSPKMPDDIEFLRACVFKWAFNAKPDLVIQISPNEVICIEAKYESNESYYPAGSKDKKIFKKRGLNRLSQIDFQVHMFTFLLGMKVTHFLLAPSLTSERANEVTWQEAFSCLNLNDMHTFVSKSLVAVKMISRPEQTSF